MAFWLAYLDAVQNAGIVPHIVYAMKFAQAIRSVTNITPAVPIVGTVSIVIITLIKGVIWMEAVLIALEMIGSSGGVNECNSEGTYS